MKVRVCKKENVLFALKVIFTPVVLFAIIIGFAFCVMDTNPEEVSPLAVLPVFIFYFLLIAVWVYFRKIFLVGYLKGNGVEINQEQFPEFYVFYQKMAEELNMKKLPPLFVLQEGGSLNAFAIRFSCKNYIAIFSDIFELYDTEPEVVKFVLAHELGHVKRNHLQKRFWTGLSSLIPFLGAAYSRACEYTCDNIGCDLSENGAEKGLLVLAAGKSLYAKMNAAKYIENAKKSRSASVVFSELCSSHPYLPNRIKNIQNAPKVETAVAAEAQEN